MVSSRAPPAVNHYLVRCTTLTARYPLRPSSSRFFHACEFARSDFDSCFPTLMSRYELARLSMAASVEEQPLLKYLVRDPLLAPVTLFLLVLFSARWFAHSDFGFVLGAVDYSSGMLVRVHAT